MTPPGARPPPATGWLARQLVTAEHNLRDAESQIEGFLSSLFRSGWNGWSFQSTDGIVTIEVYQVDDSAEAAAALHRAGFAVVVLHGHEASHLIRCICTRRLAAD